MVKVLLDAMVHGSFFGAQLLFGVVKYCNVVSKAALGENTRWVSTEYLYSERKVFCTSQHCEYFYFYEDSQTEVKNTEYFYFFKVFCQNTP